MIMLGYNDNEVANASGVGSFKKAIVNPLACEIVAEPYVRHEADPEHPRLKKIKRNIDF